MKPGQSVRLESPYGGIRIKASDKVVIHVENGALGVIDNLWTNDKAPKVRFEAEKSLLPWVAVPLHWIRAVKPGEA